MAYTGNPNAAQWRNIPAELRALRQWVGFDLQWDAARGKTIKMPYDVKTGSKASVSNPSTWATFDEAVSSKFKYIGFAFTDADPYVVIDIDHKDGEHADSIRKTQASIITNSAPTPEEGVFWGSYTETSVSGLGTHVIVKGRLSSGRRDDAHGIEIYPNGRFVILTGDVWPNRADIIDCQRIIDMLVMNMPEPAKVADLTSHEAEYTDEVLLERIANSTNGQKFQDLWNNDWEANWPDLYGDKSKADMSLLTFLDFHTKDVEQVKRLFRASGIYRPSKEVGRKHPDEYILMTLAKARAKNEADNPPMSDPDSVRAMANAIVASAAEKKTAIAAKPKHAPKGLPMPPGFMGALATELMEATYRPVPEAAMVAALGYMAGICGRQFNYSRTGLNLYLILVAKSGVGKEGIATSLGQLRTQMQPRVPVIGRFQGPAKFPSATGLMRNFETSPCFMSILGEFGKVLAHMLDPNNTHQMSVEASILDLYNKSGRWDSFAGVTFAQKENKIDEVQSPAMSVIGETVPGSLFDNLTAKNVESGLIPRFLLFEYTGERVRGNKTNRREFFSTPLLDHLEHITNTVLSHETNNVVVDVQADHDADKALEAFEYECDDIINATDVEHLRQLWNRSHLNALRVAALLAVADNPVSPTIKMEHVEWGIMVAKRTAVTLESKFESGEIGTVFDKRERAIVDLFTDAMAMERTEANIAKLRNSYKMPKALAEQPLGVSRSYFIKRGVQQKALFDSDRSRAADIIMETVDGLVRDGVLEKIGKEEALQLGIKVTGQAIIYVAGPNFE